jgi:anti-sigma regulatory factor (Ser/Thr protein kinase)
MAMDRHETLPKSGTFTRENDSDPVDGRNPANYLLRALSSSCELPIRIAAYQRGAWAHVPPPDIIVAVPIFGAAAARVRQLTAEYLRQQDMGYLADDAVAIASELIANAVAAVPSGTAGLAIVFAIHATPDAVSIYAWDIGPGVPRRVDAPAGAESGRGLSIVHALTGGDWGYWPTSVSGGKVTWATLAVPIERRLLA